LVGLGFAEDGENDAAVGAYVTKESCGGAQDVAGAAADGRVVVGGWIVDEGAAGVSLLRLPPRSPNLNAHAERFVRSIKQECLRQVVPARRAPLAHRRR
jgi:transposase InsO family protein